MAEQGNMSDLWKRLRFVFFAILIYRIGTHIPIPGIDPDRLAALFQQNQGTIIEMFNLFSGGALERMSIFALNVVPYISSAIIMQLFSNSIPYLQELKKDGQAGRNAITQYTRYGTAILAFIQASALAVTLSASGLAYVPGPSFFVSAVFSVVAGTMFLMWLGEQVSERGIGNGISIIIAVACKHRSQVYEFSRFIIEEIKKKTPIWKKEHYKGEDAKWLEGQQIQIKK